MQFRFPKQPFIPEIFDQLLKTIKDAIEKDDYDSGWVATPTDKVFTHNLTVLPRTVQVQASDNDDGTEFYLDTYGPVSKTTITVHTGKAYCRVLLNK